MRLLKHVKGYLRYTLHVKDYLNKEILLKKSLNFLVSTHWVYSLLLKLEKSKVQYSYFHFTQVLALAHRLCFWFVFNSCLREMPCSVQSCLFVQCWPVFLLVQCRENLCNFGAAFAATGYYQKFNRFKINIAEKWCYSDDIALGFILGNNV